MAIRLLSEFEHIRQRPGNYIGSTETPTHLLYELIDNAADECITNNSNFLAVILDYDTNTYSVVDKGRGIPIKSKEFKEELPILICTKLFTGGKFDNDMYQHRSGLHGEGLVIVNALSTKFEIITANKKKHRQYLFENGQLVSCEDSDPKNYSTKVTFSPDPNFFSETRIEKDIIVERLQSILAYDGNNIEINLITVEDGKPTLERINNNLVENFLSECTEHITVDITGKKDSMRLYIGYNDQSRSRKFQGVVNTLNVSAGAHQRLIEQHIRDYLYDRAQKSKMHVNKEDVLYGARIMVVMKLTNPSFSGQTKFALEMKEEDLEHIISESSIQKLLSNNADFVSRWLDIAQNYRTEIDSKRQMKTRKTRNVVLVEGLKDCLSNDTESRELFLLEGESAGGTLLNARDKNIHALLPLRGKIKNVYRSDRMAITQNKILMNIFTAINVRPFSDNIDGLRYGKICVLADADEDGKHIAMLLLSLFDKCAPKIIEEGRLYVVEAPLFGTYVKKTFYPLYTPEDVERFRKKGNEIFRFKGLGEMQPNELASSALNVSTRRLIQVQPKEDGQESVFDVWKNRTQLVSDYLFVRGGSSDAEASED